MSRYKLVKRTMENYWASEYFGKFIYEETAEGESWGLMVEKIYDIENAMLTIWKSERYCLVRLKDKYYAHAWLIMDMENEGSRNYFREIIEHGVRSLE